MAQLVVEVRDAHRRVLGFYPVERFPLNIGRAYDNDIILADPHVCARHLQVDEAGDGWNARDLNSVNGMHDDGSHSAERPLNSGDEIVIGKTHLYFFAPDHPVAETRNLHEKTSLLEASRALAIGWALLSVLVLSFAVADYMSRTDAVQVEKLIAGALPVVVGVLIWTGGWSLLAYIVRRRMHFFYFLSIAVAYVLLDLLLETLVGFIAFNIASNWISEALSYFTGGILLVALFYASMRQAFAVSSRRSLLLANLFSWGLVAVIVFVVYANLPEFDRNPQYPAELKPPVLRVVDTEAFDVFMDNTAIMLQKFDNQVREK